MYILDSLDATAKLYVNMRVVFTGKVGVIQYHEAVIESNLSTLDLADNALLLRLRYTGYPSSGTAVSSRKGFGNFFRAPGVRKLTLLVLGAQGYRIIAAAGAIHHLATDDLPQNTIRIYLSRGKLC